MWKKDDAKPAETSSSTAAPQTQAVTDRPAPMARTATPENALIGRSITIRGDLTGDEDLVIQGRVEGSVDLKEHSVTVGSHGEVSADIAGRIVTIEGRVVGNIHGGEQVTLRSAAFVQGDITAPRVVLENGARFRGLVDMGDVDERGGRAGREADAKRTAAGAVAADSSRSAAADRKPADTEKALAEPAADASPNGKGKHRTGSEAQLAG